MRVLCASSVRVGVCGVCVCLGALEKKIVYFHNDFPYFLFYFLNRRSDTDLGNTQSAPRGGERDPFQW